MGRLSVCWACGDSNSHGARPVRQIISMKEWIRTSRFSIQISLSLNGAPFRVLGVRESRVRTAAGKATDLYLCQNRPIYPQVAPNPSPLR